MNPKLPKSLVALQVITILTITFSIISNPESLKDAFQIGWTVYFFPSLLLLITCLFFSNFMLFDNPVLFFVTYPLFMLSSALLAYVLISSDQQEAGCLLASTTLSLLIGMIKRARGNQGVPDVFAIAIALFAFQAAPTLLRVHDQPFTLMGLINVCVASVILLASIFFWAFSSHSVIRHAARILIALALIFLCAFSMVHQASIMSSIIMLYILGAIILQERLDLSEMPAVKYSARWIPGVMLFFCVLVVLAQFSSLGLSHLFGRNPASSLTTDRTSWDWLTWSGFALLTLFFIHQLFLFLSRMEKNLRIILKGQEARRSSAGAKEHGAYFTGELLNELQSKMVNLEAKTSAIKEIIVKQEILQTKFQNRDSSIKFDNLPKLTNELQNIQDAPVSAQILTSALQTEFRCNYVAIYSTHQEENRLIPLAVSSRDDDVKLQDLRIRQTNEVINKAIQSQKCMVFQRSFQQQWQPIQMGGKKFSSVLIDPLYQDGVLQGLIVVADEKEDFFTEPDVSFVEITGEVLLSSWNQSSFLRSLEKLILTSAGLSSIGDLKSILNKLVQIGQTVLRNRFTAIIVQNQEQLLTSFYGKSPELHKSILSSLNQISFHLMKRNDHQIFRDFKREKVFTHLDLDESNTRTLMTVPILIHGVNIGSFMFFGKRKASNFSEKDSFLAGFLSMQASAIIEGCILDQELRNNLISTQLLHGLNLRITQANDLETAVKAVTETAHRLMRAKAAGLLLFTPDGRIEASSLSSTYKTSQDHPVELIQKSMKTKKVEILNEGTSTSIYSFPLFTTQRTYGGLWCELTDTQYVDEKLSGNIHDLVQQAAIALERAILLKETRDNADQVSLAYFQLQSTYDQTLMALVSAVDLRDRETEGHSIRVAQLALSIGKELGLKFDQLKSLERGSLLHDIGKIGIDDEILHKPGPLSEEEWNLMKQHPTMGAQIVESIPFLKDAIPVVAYHQERWDGSGYPHGLAGEDIPLLARIFAVADVFDALISDRPYHKKISPQDAVEYLKFHANILFDASIIKVLIRLYEQPNFLRKIGFYEL